MKERSDKKMDMMRIRNAGRRMKGCGDLRHRIKKGMIGKEKEIRRLQTVKEGHEIRDMKNEKR